MKVMCLINKPWAQAGKIYDASWVFRFSFDKKDPRDVLLIEDEWGRQTSIHRRNVKFLDETTTEITSEYAEDPWGTYTLLAGASLALGVYITYWLFSR